MAIVFPDTLPPYIENDPLRSSEIRVYEALKLQLPNTFHVFYSSPWLGLRSDGSEIDGECDFTIIHKNYGVLTIEVKGGGIEIDKNNVWWSKDRHGIRHKIKNPVTQARGSKYQFIEKFNQHPDLVDKYIRFNIGVILPNVKKKKLSIRPDMPPEIFACHSDMENLGEWVEDRFLGQSQDLQNGNKFDELGKFGVMAIEKMIAGRIKFDVPLNSGVSDDLSKIELMTDDQVHIIEELEENKRMAISGAAGTGKTILAIEKVKRLADKQKNVLLLCYNEPLGKYLQMIFSENEYVYANNFHSYCYKLAIESGKEVSENEISELTDNFITNFIDSLSPEYDALVIDEGQDFKEQWLEDLEIAIKGGEEGVLFIFYDDNQKLRGNVANYIYSLPFSKYALKRNLRNTKKIFRISQSYYSGKTVRCVGPQGEDIDYIKVQDPEKIGLVVRQKLGSLINDHNFLPNDIIVLVPNADYRSQICNENSNRIGGYQVQPASEFEKNKIRIDTIRRFKGLEGTVVILVVDKKSVHDTDLMYAGITRSQAYLIIVSVGLVDNELESIV